AFHSSDLMILMGKIIVLATIAIVLGKTLYNKLLDFLQKMDDDDLRIALLVGIAVTYSGFAMFLGLSEVLGAFLAGVMLAEIKKVDLVGGMVNPVKDLLIPTFFVYFGTTINVGAGIPFPFLLFVLVVWSVIAKILVGVIGVKMYGLMKGVSLGGGCWMCGRGGCSVVSNILVGVIGGKMYGLTKRVSLRAGLSMCARGEFSVVIASIAVGAIKVFAGIYIIFSAFIGMILFNYAPKITTLIYGKPVKKKKDLKVPTI